MPTRKLVHKIQYRLMVAFLRYLGRVYPEYLDGILHKEFDGTTYFIMRYRYIDKIRWKNIPQKDGVNKCIQRVMTLHKRAIEKFISQ